MPPDIPFTESLVACLVVAGLLIFGMIFESWRAAKEAKEDRKPSGLILESFEEEAPEREPSGLFKVCALNLPAPFLFAFLIYYGIRRWADLLPLFILGWVILSGALYLIFFGDLSDLRRFRRPA